MLGPVDEVIREVERAFPDLTIIVRGNRVAIVSRSKQTEAQAAQAEDLVNTIIQAAYTAPMDADTVRRMLDQNVLKNHVRLEHPGHGPVRDKLAQSTSNERAHARSAGSHDPTYRKPTVPGVITFAAGVPVRAKTAGQVAYVNAIESHTITFGIGPAGTGKTYLAVAKAVRAFQDKQIRRIILTRPAVEAGESLGFLPGTLNDKVDPYLRPLYDALGDMLGADQLKRYMDDGSIEVAPLAYMRGRTLNDAFVILDEAQNTTEQQMKMFLTRLGFNTTMVITGDISQVDLTVPRSGLATSKPPTPRLWTPTPCVACSTRTCSRTTCASNIPVTARCVTNWRNRPQTNAPMHVLPAPTTRRTASPRFPASSPLPPACRSVRKPPDKWPT